jgi:L-fucose isomerase-like protein
MQSLQQNQKDGLQKASGPVGVLVFGRKRPGFDQAWSAEIRARCTQAFAALGCQTVGEDSVVFDDESVYTAIGGFERAGCQALIVIQPSLADGQYALAVSQRWRDPVVLWATPERAGDGKVSSCSLVGQNLWASVLRQAGHAFELVYGEPEAVRTTLGTAISLATAMKHLRMAKLGMVGGHAPGFVDLAADPFLLRRTFGLQLHALSLPQFIERVQHVPAEAVAGDLANIRKLGLKGTADSSVELSDELLGVNAAFYVAMSELMREGSLDALALQCWPELPNILGQWPYFAVSRLSAEGHAVSIEGDVDGAVLALIGRLLGIGPGFLTDWLEHDESTIFFWHPGMAPLDMCNETGCANEPSVGTHFNGALPFVIDGALRVGSEVTISRLWRCDGKYHWTAFEGKAIPPRRQVTGNSVLVEVDGAGVPARFDRLIHEGLPHHVTLHYGRHADTLRRMARMLGIVWHA